MVWGIKNDRAIFEIGFCVLDTLVYRVCAILMMFHCKLRQTHTVIMQQTEANP